MTDHTQQTSPPDLDQIKSVCPWGVFRWTTPAPGRRKGWCVLTTEPSAARAAIVGEGEYLTPEQILDALSEPWREQEIVALGRGHGGELRPLPPIPAGLIDPHPELRALITRLLIENCECGGSGHEMHAGRKFPCHRCLPFRQLVERNGQA